MTELIPRRLFGKFMRGAAPAVPKPRAVAEVVEPTVMPPQPYTVEQLAAIDADPAHVYDQLRLWPTIRALLAERDGLLADLSQALTLVERQSETLTTAIAQRDEARRVAREVAALVRKHVIWQLMTHVERCRLERAEAYPEVPHG